MGRPAPEGALRRRPTGERPLTCEAAIRAASDVTEDVSHLVLDVDGTRHAGLDRHRQATRACFNLAEKSLPRYEIYPTAANGYYVMLRPLPPGTHTLNFGGKLPGMSQAVTYTLIVK